MPALARNSENSAEIAAFFYLRIAFFAPGKVDKNSTQPLYRNSWARRRLARWRVCEAPHCSHGDRACGHALVAMFASLRRMCGVLCLRHSLGEGRRGFKVPGCLTGESEERETWTAGSLRAAFATGKPYAEMARKRLRRSTFQVNTWSLKWWSFKWLLK